MEHDISTEDQNSFEVILEAQRIGTKPVEELMGLAYALGRSRGKVEALNDLQTAFTTADKAARV